MNTNMTVIVNKIGDTFKKETVRALTQFFFKYWIGNSFKILSKIWNKSKPLQWKKLAIRKIYANSEQYTGQ